MVRNGWKGKTLGKEKKLEILSTRRKIAENQKKRDDKKWKRVLAKMATKKKEKYAGVGGTSEKGRVRGATRAALRKKTGRKEDTVTYEMTIHLSKYLQGKKFAIRPACAVKTIQKITRRLLKTKDNKIDSSLNTFLWSRGVKSVPGRVRVRIQRKVADATEGSKRKRLFTVISHVPVENFKGLTTKTVSAK